MTQKIMGITTPLLVGTSQTNGMLINKSYSYYYINCSNEQFNSFFSTKNAGLGEYFFNYSLNNIVQQGMCDILPNKKGIFFTQNLLQQFEPIKLLNEFQSCFAYNLPTEISDPEQTRFKKNYSFDFDMKTLINEIPMELILQYELSPWKSILEIDADYFYLKNNEQTLLGSKDYKQVENWLIKINNDIIN